MTFSGAVRKCSSCSSGLDRQRLVNGLADAGKIGARPGLRPGRYESPHGVGEGFVEIDIVGAPHVLGTQAVRHRGRACRQQLGKLHLHLAQAACADREVLRMPAVRRRFFEEAGIDPLARDRIAQQCDRRHRRSAWSRCRPSCTIRSTVPIPIAGRTTLTSSTKPKSAPNAGSRIKRARVARPEAPVWPWAGLAPEVLRSWSYGREDDLRGASTVKKSTSQAAPTRGRLVD